MLANFEEIRDKFFLLYKTREDARYARFVSREYELADTIDKQADKMEDRLRAILERNRE